MYPDPPVVPGRHPTDGLRVGHPEALVAAGGGDVRRGDDDAAEVLRAEAGPEDHQVVVVAAGTGLGRLEPSAWRDNDKNSFFSTYLGGEVGRHYSSALLGRGCHPGDGD